MAVLKWLLAISIVISYSSLINAGLTQITTSCEYKKIKSNSPQHAVYFYNVVSGKDKFATSMKDQLTLVDGHLKSLDMKVPLYFVDCKMDNVNGVCDHKDAVSGNDYFLIKLVDDRRDTMLSLQPRNPKLDDHDLLDLYLRFYSKSWKNFHTINKANEAVKLIQKNPTRDWFLCYEDRDHKFGKSFCHQFSASNQDRKALSTIVLDKKSLIQELNKLINVDMEMPSSSQPFAMWYFDCISDDEIDCKAFPYRMDEKMVNAKHFSKIVRYGPLVEMTAAGKIPSLYGFQCALLYYFYRSAKLRWETAKIKAFDVSNQLRGAAIVVLVDIDQVESTVLAKAGVDAKRDEFPQWKFQMWRADVAQQESREQLQKINGCPVEYVMNQLKSAYDLNHLHKSTTDDDMPIDNEEDTKAQDDEVELLLQSQRDEACYFCPVEYKRVTALTDKTYQKFIEKKSITMVLFWLNVDTTSRSALSSMVEASTLLDTNFKAFGSVACHDWPDVCQKAQVKTWPKMFVYSKGQRMREYKSLWDAKLLANSAMLFSSPPLTYLNSVTDLENFINSGMIKLANNTYLQTVTIGMFKTEKAREIRALTEAAKKMHGQYAFGLASGKWLKEWVNDQMGPLELPIIITRKNNDELEKTVLMDEVEDTTPESIINFVQMSSRPIIPSLTKLSFPTIINRKVPVIILIGNDPRNSDFFIILRKVEECLMSRNYVCVTLDADHERNLTKYLLRAYGLHESQLPVVAYVNPKNGHVHVLTKGDANKSIKNWLEYIKKNMLKPNVILQEKKWPPKPLMYDYSKLSQNMDPKDAPKSTSEWRKSKARPWGKPDLDETMDMQMKMDHESTEDMNKMDRKLRNSEEKKSNMKHESMDADQEMTDQMPDHKQKYRKISKKTLAENSQNRMHEDHDEL